MTDQEEVLRYYQDYETEHGRRPSAATVSAALPHVAPAAVKTIYRVHLSELPMADYERAALEFIKTAIVADGWAPTIREIAAAIHRTISQAHLAVARLAVLGHLEVGENPRQIRVVGSVVQMPEVSP